MFKRRCEEEISIKLEEEKKKLIIFNVVEQEENIDSEAKEEII